MREALACHDTLACLRELRSRQLRAFTMHLGAQVSCNFHAMLAMNGDATCSGLHNFSSVSRSWRVHYLTCQALRHVHVGSYVEWNSGAFFIMIGGAEFRAWLLAFRGGQAHSHLRLSNVCSKCSMRLAVLVEPPSLRRRITDCFTNALIEGYCAVPPPGTLGAVV